MKKLTLTLALIVFSIVAFAQGEPFNKFYTKYSENEQFTQVININKKMMSLIATIEPGSPNEKEVLAAISKLEGIKIIGSDSLVNARKYFNEASAALSKPYEELMSIKSGKDDMKFMIKEANGKISELLMLVGGDKKFFYLTIYGEIDLKQISKISKSLNIDGMEYLEKAGEKPAPKK